MTLNRARLAEALTFVEQAAARQQPYPLMYPEDEVCLDPNSDSESTTWNQGDWSTLRRSTFTDAEFKTIQDSNESLLETCGTAYCVAGYVTSRLPGYRSELEVEIEVGTYASQDSHTVKHYVSLLEFVNAQPISYDEHDPSSHFQLARVELGLTNGQAGALFDGNNDVTRVRELIAEFLAEEDAERA